MSSTTRFKAAGATLAVGLLLAIALAATAQAVPQGMSAQQAKVVLARAEAMNGHYQRGARIAVARRAEERRAQATNAFYGLARNDVAGASNRFDRTDVDIGAGALLVAIMVAGGLTVALRRRSVGGVSSPRTL
jgi:hypothetical protein